MDVNVLPPCLNKIDCFQMEDVFELPKTTDSEVDNLDKFDVEQNAQEEASQDTQENAGLECSNAYIKKKNAPHGQLSIHS